MENNDLLGEPGNGCALFCRRVLYVSNNEPYVHYCDALCSVISSVLHHKYRITEKCV